MTPDEKELSISLVRLVEALLIEKAALTRVTELHRIPPHVREAAVACLRNDQTIAGIIHLKVQPIYDLIELAPDVKTVVEQLLLSKI
jgi:hypothetical protein